MNDTLHSIEPWFVARYQPRFERTARENLARVGFETWYPTIVELRPMPLNKLTANKRRHALNFLREVRRPRFVGYILIRELPTCIWDVNRINELSGVGSIVTFGSTPAKIQDFDVELMRIAEATGQFDVHTYAGPPGRYRIGSRIDDANSVWVSQGKKLLELDVWRKSQVSIDAFGRFERVVQEDLNLTLRNSGGRKSPRAVASSA